MCLFMDPFLHATNIYGVCLLCPRHWRIEISLVLTPQEVVVKWGSQASRQIITRQEESNHGRRKGIGPGELSGKAFKEA